MSLDMRKQIALNINKAEGSPEAERLDNGTEPRLVFGSAVRSPLSGSEGKRLAQVAFEVGDDERSHLPLVHISRPFLQEHSSGAY